MTPLDAAQRRYTPIHLLNAALLAGLWLFTALTYADLPDQIPAHLGASGIPTRWTDRDSGIWFVLPILGTFHAFLLYVLSFAAAGSPTALNIPGKKRLLALPPEGQRYAMEPSRPFMFGMTTWLLALTLIVQLQMHQAAHAGPATEGNRWLLPFVLAFTALPLAGAWWLSRAVRRRIDHWLASTGTTLDA